MFNWLEIINQSWFSWLFIVIVPLFSLLRQDLKSQLIKQDKLESFLFFPFIILAYLLSRLFLGYIYNFMVDFTLALPSAKINLAKTLFWVIDLGYWLIVDKIPWLKKHLILGHYTTFYLIECIILLPMSMIITAIALQF